MKNLRCAFAIVHPGRGRDPLMLRGHEISTGVEVEHEEQVSSSASHPAG